MVLEADKCSNRDIEEALKKLREEYEKQNLPQNRPEDTNVSSEKNVLQRHRL